MKASPSLSLERKLPLLISVFLISLAIGLTAAGYHEVKQASELRGIDRLQRLTSQLAELAGNSTQQRFASIQHVAADSAIVSYLSGARSGAAGHNAALAALAKLSLNPTDTGLVAEVRSTTEATTVATRPELTNDEEPIAALVRKLSRGQAAIGDLAFHGDSAYYWVGGPVVGSGRILGYVLLRRTFTTSPRVEQQIRQLAGNDSVFIYIASDSGAKWARISGQPASAPTAIQQLDEGPNVVQYEREQGRKYVGVYARVPNTPFRLISELGYTALLERPSAFLQRSIAVASVMLLIGIMAAWILSRRITRPLTDLTMAADAISTGNYGHRAPVSRRDETGRLADAFNTMAEQVQRSHDDLERQIAESRLLAARLEEANRAKADFLATMSHELRTPLNAIGGYVDLIELGVRGPITEGQRRDLERVRYNQRHLLALIGSILDFTRLDARKLPFEIGNVRVDRVARDVLSAMTPLLDEKSLTRECTGCDKPVIARADRNRLEQIMLNLLSNAVRFTPPAGSVTIGVCELDGEIEITVADTGIGIPREKLGAIFEPFVQVESGLTRTVGGTGLGLTISRSLARGMGGELTADSDGSAGAVFRLTIPAAGDGRRATEDDGRLADAMRVSPV